MLYHRPLVIFLAVGAFYTLVGVACGGILAVDHTDLIELSLHPDTAGELAILLTGDLVRAAGEGVNPEAVIGFGPVVTIENVIDPESAPSGADTRAVVWIDHALGGEGIVTFSVDGHGPIEAPADDAKVIHLYAHSPVSYCGFLSPTWSSHVFMALDRRMTASLYLKQ